MRSLAVIVVFSLFASSVFGNAQDADGLSEPLVTLHVIDDGTDKPIERFRVLPGTPFSGTGEDAVAVWQPHLIRESTDGRFVWPQERSYAQFRLRVEADGYKPAATRWFEKSAGPQEATVRLRRDSGVEVRVLSPNGKPAAGATLAVALPNRTARLEGRSIAGAGEPPAEKMGDRWRKAVAGTAGADGRFRLTSETDPSAVLVVVHKNGYAQAPFSKLFDPDENNGAVQDIRLVEWGAIRGRLLWGERPLGSEHVNLIVSRDSGYPGMLSMISSTQTDAEGHFTFEDVPPGTVQLSRLVPKADGSGPTKYQFPVMHASVSAGGVTEVVLGGTGPEVIGRLTGLESYEGVTLRVHPRAPHVGLRGDEEQWKGFGELRAPLGEVVSRSDIAVEKDGSFRIEGLIPEWYQVIVNDSGKGLRGGASFTLKPAKEDADEVQDIGEVRVSVVKE